MFRKYRSDGTVRDGSGVVAPTSTTDNAIVRWDGTIGAGIQNSSVVIDDSGNATGFGTINHCGDFSFKDTSVLDKWHVAQANGMLAATTLALTANRCYCAHICGMPPNGMTIDKIGITVNALSGTSSTIVAIYETVSVTDPRPGTLLDQSGLFDTSTTGSAGLKSYTLATPLVLVPTKRYCLALWSNGTPTLNALSNGSNASIHGVNITTPTTLNRCIYAGGTFGAFPANGLSIGTFAYLTSGNAPPFMLYHPTA